MRTKSKMRQAKAVLRNVDDIMRLVTGKRLKDVLERAAILYGEEVARKAGRLFADNSEPEVPADSPYAVLGVYPDALDIVVRGAYRSLAREYHPDTGTKPDVAKFQKATEAYGAIMAERQAQREKECQGKS